MLLTDIIDPISKYLNWLDDVSNVWTICIRIFLAFVCGGIIGVEREKKRHAAGFRTYILVCLGAAVVMMLNEYLNVKTGADASRLGAQVISGIGFLGAGTILITSKNRIKGLTTAAGLWTSACTGLAIGSGFYTLGLITTLSIVLILSLMPSFEMYFRRKSTLYEIHIELYDRHNLKDLVNYLRVKNVKIISIDKNPAYHDSGLSVYTLLLALKEKQERYTFIKSLQDLNYVNFCEEIN